MKNKKFREYQTKWRADRRKAWIDANGPCKKCGSKDRLEVDHIDPNEKHLEAGTLWSRIESVRVEELAKCQVLCYNCHKEKSKIDRTKPDHEMPHGTNSRYMTRNCRCRECVSAHSKVNSEWRRQNKLKKMEDKLSK